MSKQLTYESSAKTANDDVMNENVVTENVVNENAVQNRPLSWKDFVHVTKPGIVFDNFITTFGGFWLAAGWNIPWILLVYTLLGTMLIVASGCVLNNYLDRDLDKKMVRTSKRPLSSGRMDPKIGLWYGILLGVGGLTILGVLVNPISALLGLIGLFVYVWIYTVWLKRTSTWGTVVGAISGAMPPVIGYAAVTGTLDVTAAILFGILFLWQPPHFWALGIFRKEDYRAAGFPMLPVVYGNDQTKISILRYVVLLVPVSLLLYLYGNVGIIYLFGSAALGLIWVFMAMAGFRAEDENRWAKRMFIYSVNYLTILFLIIVLDTTAK